MTDALLAETRAFNAELERRLAAEPSVMEAGAVETRRRRRAGEGTFPAPVYLPEARDLTAPGPGGPVGLRVVMPAGEPTGVYVHLHGGGWVLGAGDMQDPLLAEVAATTGLAAVSVDYRLAPEHPYPAGPDDCEAAALWLLERGAEELGAPRRLAIGGESAGAHLSVVTLLRLRDRHGITGAFLAANLVYGAYDLSGTPSQRLWGDRDLVLSTPIIAWFGDQFLPGVDLEARRDPDISPLYARLHDLPPALFTVGTLDPLLDDTLFMEARWRAAGHRTDLRIFDEGVHGFATQPMGIAGAAREVAGAFLREQLSALEA